MQSIPDLRVELQSVNYSSPCSAFVEAFLDHGNSSAFASSCIDAKISENIMKLRISGAKDFFQSCRSFFGTREETCLVRVEPKSCLS